MRESLHSFVLATALPLAALAVWAVRGDLRGDSRLETAMAYRVELAELPLPRAERLRPPHEPQDWRRDARAVEEPVVARRREALPAAAAPASAAPLSTPRASDDPSVVLAPRAQAAADDGAGANRTLPAVGAVGAATPALRSPGASVPARAEARPAADADASETNEATATRAAEPARQAAASAAQTNPPESTIPVKSSPAPAASARSLASPAIAASAGAVKPAPVTPSSVTMAAAPSTLARANATQPPARVAPAPTPQRRESESDWRETLAAAAPSPAVADAARGSRGARKGIELALDARQRAQTPSERGFPTLAPPLSAFPLAGTKDRIASVPAPSTPEPSLPALVLPVGVAETIARQHGDELAGEVGEPGLRSRGLPELFTLVTIPEPATAALIGAALATLALARRRGRRG